MVIEERFTARTASHRHCYVLTRECIFIIIYTEIARGRGIGATTKVENEIGNTYKYKTVQTRESQTYYNIHRNYYVYLNVNCNPVVIYENKKKQQQLNIKRNTRNSIRDMGRKMKEQQEKKWL